MSTPVPERRIAEHSNVDAAMFREHILPAARPRFCAAWSPTGRRSRRG
ncbi:hypothetical protein [Brevundimonas denitrificans]|nr:hypothetical protein [Brevundimonas denitrificans]